MRLHVENEGMVNNEVFAPKARHGHHPESYGGTIKTMENFIQLDFIEATCLVSTKK